MKALTIWQPYASLIIEGAKPYEFRGWKPPADLIGQRIVIHAAARPVDIQETREILHRLQAGGEIAAETCLIAEKAIPVLSSILHETLRGGVVIGCALGTAVLGEPKTGRDILEEFGVKGVDEPSRSSHWNFGWPLTDIVKFPEAIPERGRQKLWNWSKEGDDANG